MLPWFHVLCPSSLDLGASNPEISLQAEGRQGADGWWLLHPPVVIAVLMSGLDFLGKA